MRRIYLLLKYPRIIIRKYLKILFFFIIPNLRFFLSKRLTLKKIPKFQQKTILSGLGTVIIGKKCSFGEKLGGFNRCGSIEIQPRYIISKIVIGDNVSTNNNVFICAANSIEIEKNVLIGQNVTIMDHEAHGIEPDKRGSIGQIGFVKIGSNVWIGNNVIIMKNTLIGDNTIVAAGAVVVGKYPPNVIIGGVPAKIIRHI